MLLKVSCRPSAQALGWMAEIRKSLSLPAAAQPYLQAGVVHIHQTHLMP